jgi:integrase
MAGKGCTGRVARVCVNLFYFLYSGACRSGDVVSYVVRDFAIDSAKYTIQGQHRRKIICVRSGDASFTSKNQWINQGYVVGCERALLPDWRQARIFE